MSVLVYTENWNGKFKKSAFELVSYAYETAKLLNTTCTAIAIGNIKENVLKQLSQYGAQKIINVKNEILNDFSTQAYSNAITQVAEKEGVEAVILGNGLSGKALSPRLSVKLKAGLVSGATALPKSIKPFLITKNSFTGKAFADVEVKTEKVIITLAQNSFGIVEEPQNANIEYFDANIESNIIKTTIKEVSQQTDKVILTDAEIVVSGGRGMKGAENWQPLVDIANLLGGATACSRPVSDEGWRPHEEHTGQTGKIISPNLYFAFGISGAIQHLAGVSSSKCIVAVNTDKDAPIFEAADYGIIGDVRKVLPELLEALKEFKANQ